MEFLSEPNLQFLLVAGMSIVCGFFMGVERESRGKPAGISTNILVCLGSALITMISIMIEPASKGQVAANIVTGIGFLGAGLIIKNEEGFVMGLTTAAGVWLTAAIGMAIGFGWYFAAIVSTIIAVFIPRLPHFFGLAEQASVHDKTAKKRPHLKAKV